MLAALKITFIFFFGTNGNKPMLELSRLEKEITRRWWFWKVGIKGLVMTYSTLRKQWHQDQGKLGKRFSLASRWASIHFEILVYRVRSTNFENVSIQLELKSNSEMVIKKFFKMSVRFEPFWRKKKNRSWVCSHLGDWQTLLFDLAFTLSRKKTS